MTKEEYLNSIGLETIYFPKNSTFGKLIENEFYTVEIQVVLDENMNYVNTDINSFISNINDNNIDKIFKNYLEDLEEIKYIYREIINHFKVEN